MRVEVSLSLSIAALLVMMFVPMAQADKPEADLAARLDRVKLIKDDIVTEFAVSFRSKADPDGKDAEAFECVPRHSRSVLQRDRLLGG